MEIKNIINHSISTGEVNMPDFFDFIMYASDKKSIATNVVKKMKSMKAENDKDTLQLQKWFKDQGYDISLNHCKEIIKNKDHLLDITNAAIVKNY